MIEEGMLSIFVGGGQPDYYEGYVAGSVQITDTQPLESCTFGNH